MRIDVALLPSFLSLQDSPVCVVVDALRATSTLAVLAARGVAEVAIASTVEEALLLKQREFPGWLLCGEAGGLPPEGFDHGNSPAEFAEQELDGQRAILATSNGTRALTAAADASAVFTGSLLNLTACARAAAHTAREQRRDITLVCAGTSFGTAFSLEDTGVCGAIVEAIVREYGSNIADAGEITLSDTAMAAYRLWRSYMSPRLMMGEAVHGQHLTNIGLAADLDFCSQVDLYAVAPQLHKGSDGVLLIRSAERSPLTIDD